MPQETLSRQDAVKGEFEDFHYKLQQIAINHPGKDVYLNGNSGNTDNRGQQVLFHLSGPNISQPAAVTRENLLALASYFSETNPSSAYTAIRQKETVVENPVEWATAAFLLRKAEKEALKKIREQQDILPPKKQTKKRRNRTRQRYESDGPPDYFRRKLLTDYDKRREEAKARALVATINRIDFTKTLSTEPDQIDANNHSGEKESLEIVLTPDNLDTLALTIESPKYKRMKEALSNPFDILTTGLRVKISDNPEEDTTELPQMLLYTAQSLKEEGPQKTFTSWVEKNMIDSPEIVTTTLTTLSNFMMFLDSESLVQAFKMSSGLVPLAPFKGLYDSLTKAKESISSEKLRRAKLVSDADTLREWNKPLNRANERIIETISHIETNFSFAVNAWSGNEGISSQIARVDENRATAQEVVKTFMRHARREMAREKDEEAAIGRLSQIAIRLSHSYWHGDFRELLNEMETSKYMRSSLDIKLIERIKYQANKHGELPDNSYKHQLLDAKIWELENGRWAEPTIVNWVLPTTNKVRLYEYTGSFAPYTKGHHLTVKNTIDQPSNEGEQIVVVILPIPTVKDLDKKSYKKKVTTGPLQERSEAIMCSVDEPREKVLLSTAQPVPGEKQRDGNVRTREENFLLTTNKLRQAVLRKHPNLNVEVIQLCGSDELDKSTQMGTIYPEQKAKFTNRNIKTSVIAREPGDTVILLNSIDTIRGLNVCEITLSPGHNSSSTRARDRVKYGGYAGNLMQPTPQSIAQVWTTQAIKSRETTGDYDGDATYPSRIRKPRRNRKFRTNAYPSDKFAENLAVKLREELATS